MRFPREFYIPKGAVKITDKQSDAVAYIYERGGRPCAMVFFGKADKPAGHFNFKSAERRAQYVKASFEARGERTARVQARRVERAAWVNPYKVGDLFKTCWGYDQTNVEYFEAVAVKGKYVTVREIAQARVEYAWAQGRCVPLPGQYKGEPLRRLAQENGIKIDDVRRASFVKPTVVAGVPTYDAAHWSATH